MRYLTAATMLVVNSLFILVVWATRAVAYPMDNCHNETGRCFWRANVPGLGSWDQGRLDCQAEGGDLAVIETQELFDFVIGTGL